MDCEFEEKEYEGPLNQELLGNDHRIWSPGQVFERHMGIDSALMVNSQSFWKMLGYKHPLPGVILNNFRFGYIWNKTRGKRMLPTFSINLFIQAKRPECMKRSNYSIGMYAPYYRYKIRAHQQKALERLSEKLNNRGSVMYAAPVFGTHEELFRVIQNREIVEQSNFVQAHLLRNHEKWNYMRAGCSGVAHSEPERIQEPNFQDQLGRLSSLSEEFDNRREDMIDEDLKFLSKSMLESAKETREESPISVEYLRRTEGLYGESNNSRRIFKSYMSILIFCQLFSLHWHVISSEKQNYY